MINEINTELAIIGGGPAGISAAAIAAKYGVSFVLLENGIGLGGQFMSIQPARNALDKNIIKDIQEKIQKVSTTGDHIFTHSLIYQVDTSNIYFTDQENNYSLRYKALLIANGAREHIMPFTGWTLPGVITTGAAQRLVSQKQVNLGKKVIVAGSGILLIQSAARLLNAGVNIVAVIDATPTLPLFKQGAYATLFHPSILFQFYNHSRSLWKSKIPYLGGHAVIEANGEIEVMEAISAPLDNTKTPIREKARKWDVDTICVTNGLEPNTQLLRMLGVNLNYDPRTESFFPEYDQTMLTSLPGIYVAGEVAGIGGAKKALIEGEIAGLQIAFVLGHASRNNINNRLKLLKSRRNNEVLKYRRLNNAFIGWSDLFNIIEKKTVICRCEEISMGTLKNEISQNDGTLRDIKMRTRTGMGMCQGRGCEGIVIHELANANGSIPKDHELWKIRPPVEPIPAMYLSKFTKGE